MLVYPNHLNEQRQLLQPGHGLGEVADNALLALEQHGFAATVGLCHADLPDIAAMTREDDVREYCPNDTGRLGTPEGASAWVAKDGGRGMVVIHDVAELGQSPARPELSSNVEALRPVAYGWSGYLRNHHIEGADITTAYRVGVRGQQLARERRDGSPDRFGLGQQLGELVIASAVVLYGADPASIALEVWQSNQRAVGLYERLGFLFKRAVPDYRPTLKPIGSQVDGNTVYERIEDGKKRIVVDDVRLHYRLGKHPLLASAS